jgi:hypothetical protein
MNPTACSRVCFARVRQKGETNMRNMIFGAATAFALASPTVAADLPERRYGEVPTYQREVHPYDYRYARPIIVEEPLVSETVVVRRRVIVAPPPVFVEEDPIYAVPPVYAAPAYAYAAPAWRGGWGYRRPFYGRW